MSVTSPIPPTGIPPVPLVTIHTHIVTWLSTSWRQKRDNVGHHYPLVIGLVAMHIVYQQPRKFHIYTDCDVTILCLFIYVTHGSIHMVTVDKPSTIV